MRRLLFLLLLASGAFAQQQPPTTYWPTLITYNGAPTGVCDVYQFALNVTTGDYYSCNPKTRVWVKAGAGVATVSTLPSAATYINQLYIVTDGTSSSDCVTGGGSTRALCVSNGVSWLSVGGGASTAVGPNVAVIASPNCPLSGSTVCNFVNADMHFSSTATTTNGSGIVTLPNSDWNFNGTDANGKPIMKVGQICEATTSGGTQVGINGVRVIAQGTISSINSNTSATCSNNANANAAVGTTWFFWGDDDTSNLSTFWTNVGCGRGILPAGYMFVQSAEFITAPSANCSTLSNSVYSAPAIQGQGITATWIVPTFNFNASTCTGGINSDACFGGTANTDWRDLTIWGGGDPRTNSGTTHNIFALGSASRAYNIDVEYWATAELGWTGCIFGGSQDIFQLGGCFGTGGKRQAFVPAGLSNPVISISNYWAGPAVNTSAALDVAGAMVEVNDVIIGNGTAAAAHIVESGGISTCWSCSLQSQTGVSAARIDGTMQFHDSFVGCLFAGCTAPAGTSAVYNQANGAKIYAENTRFTAGSGGGNINFVTATGNFFDEGGNTFSGGSLVVSPANGNVIGETNSANQILITAAKLVLSAGWGTTAANTALSGGNAPIQFTITNSGTGQGASPTITYTFPTPYLVAPFSCTATQTGGTNAVGTFTSSSLSATGVTFTFSLTPTASSTEIVQVTCVTP